jgi:peptidoglycan/xylan/chitin deacetylase (PgdA/CDA1 family)
MRKQIIKFIGYTDTILKRMYTNNFRSRKGLYSFMFHGNVLGSEDIDSDVLLPQPMISFNHLRKLIQYFFERDFSFISPEDILNGSTNSGNSILLTFDDGYSSNRSVLPILKEFNVPALFFVTTDNVIQSKAFWWDSVYRGFRQENSSMDQIGPTIENLKKLHHNQIEDIIVEKFGYGALTPVGDLDRPLSPDELKAFSEEPLVYIGNHTDHHSSLPYYSDREIEMEILSAQEKLLEITGSTPQAIAYPYGMMSDRVIEITRKCGLKLGFTVFPKKNKPISELAADDLLRINRFMIKDGPSILDQLEMFHSDIQLEAEVIRLLFKFRYR